MAWNLAAVEQAFADAALDPLRWNAAMDVAAQATGGSGAVLLPVSGHLPHFPFSESLTAMADSYVRGGWYLRDARFLGVKNMIANGVYVDFDVMNFDGIKRHTPIGRNFSRRTEIAGSQA